MARCTFYCITLFTGFFQANMIIAFYICHVKNTINDVIIKYHLVLGICSLTDTNQYRQNSIDTDTSIGIGASVLGVKQYIDILQYIAILQ